MTHWLTRSMTIDRDAWQADGVWEGTVNANEDLMDENMESIARDYHWISRQLKLRRVDVG